MSELAHYPNVLYLCNEESIHDLISVSDLWTCFESTTALESWLMGKQTIFINPEPNFNRDPLYKGSALANSYNEFCNMIYEYYSTGKLSSFFLPEKVEIRKELIKNIIGYGDGLNHIRVSYYFKKTLDKISEGYFKPTYKLHLWHFIVYLLIRIAAPFYNRKIYSKIYKLKKHLWVFENYKMEKLNHLYKRYKTYLDEFYEVNKIEEKYHTDVLFKSLFK